MYIADWTKTSSEVLRTIRNSHCSKRRGRSSKLKVQTGIYGQTMENAIERLARKMKLSFRIVRAHVARLINRGLVVYSRDRLVVTKQADKQVRRLNPVITPAETPNNDAIVARYEQLSNQNVREALRKQAWSEHYAAAA